MTYNVDVMTLPGSLSMTYHSAVKEKGGWGADGAREFVPRSKVPGLVHAAAR
jgi:hypothetical protein